MAETLPEGLRKSTIPYHSAMTQILDLLAATQVDSRSLFCLTLKAAKEDLFERLKNFENVDSVERGCKAVLLEIVSCELGPYFVREGKLRMVGDMMAGINRGDGIPSGPIVSAEHKRHFGLT